MDLTEAQQLVVDDAMLCGDESLGAPVERTQERLQDKGLYQGSTVDGVSGGRTRQAMNEAAGRYLAGSTEPLPEPDPDPDPDPGAGFVSDLDVVQYVAWGSDAKGAGADARSRSDILRGIDAMKWFMSADTNHQYSFGRNHGHTDVRLLRSIDEINSEYGLSQVCWLLNEPRIPGSGGDHSRDNTADRDANSVTSLKFQLWLRYLGHELAEKRVNSQLTSYEVRDIIIVDGLQAARFAVSETADRVQDTEIETPYGATTNWLTHAALTGDPHETGRYDALGILNSQWDMTAGGFQIYLLLFTDPSGQRYWEYWWEFGDGRFVPAPLTQPTAADSVETYSVTSNGYAIKGRVMTSGEAFAGAPAHAMSRTFGLAAARLAA